MQYDTSMTRKNKRKQKKSSESDDDFNESKRINIQNSPEGFQPISQVLCEANSVLLDEGISVPISNLYSPLNVLSDMSDTNGDSDRKLSSMGDHTGPTNSDIIAMLGKITLKLNDMDNRLKALDTLEKKVDNFDKEQKKLWIHIDRITKEHSEKLNRVENKVDSVDIELDGARKRISDLEREKDKLKDDINYVQSQSMRNNLIFGNIPEEVNETPERAEEIIRDFIVKKMKIAKETVDNMRFERVHRMGQKRSHTAGLGTARKRDQPGELSATEGGSDMRPRSIVAKFCFFSDREQVRGNSKNLQGTNFYVTEQFPPEVAAKRRRLLKRAKEEKRAGRKAWVSYDTLYVDGRPIRDT